MNVITRGFKNAFRNVIRTVSLVVILGISIGLALSMLVAYQAVNTKIENVKASVGNTVSISPAGVRGFEGGGDPLTEDDLSKVVSLDHVTGVTKALSDRLTTDNTDLESAVDAGSLGRRNANNSGQGFEFQGGAPGGGNGSNAGSNNSSGNSQSQVTRTFTPPVTLIGTTDPTNLSTGSMGGGTFTLKDGEVFDGSSSEYVAVIGSSLAEKNDLSVGSTFTAYNKTIKVIGIFDAGNTFSNNQVLMPLQVVQALSDQAGSVTSATLTVDSITNVESVTNAASKALGDAADVTNAAAQAESSITPLENIRTISLYSLFGAVIAGAVIILLTMIMIVRERRREIGVLKAIGANNRTVTGQFAIEAVTLTLLGSVVGMVIGVLAGGPITKMLVNNASSSTTAAAGGPGGMGGGPGRAFGGLRESVLNVQIAVGWEIILYGLAAVLVIALLGSVLASFFISKIRPAEVMHAE